MFHFVNAARQRALSLGCVFKLKKKVSEGFSKMYALAWNNVVLRGNFVLWRSADGGFFLKKKD